MRPDTGIKLDDREIAVRAEWDSEAAVWYVAETPLPGLNARNPSNSSSRYCGMIQDLLEEGGEWGDSGEAGALNLEVTAHTTTLVRRAAA